MTKPTKRTMRQTKTWLHKLKKYKAGQQAFALFDETLLNTLNEDQLQLLLAVCKVAYEVGVENTRTPGQIYMEVI